MAANDAIPVLSANGLVVRYGVQTLLNEATLALHEGERIGLVGRNGCGKSTFLRICAGELEPDGGEVTRRRNALTGWLPQDFGIDTAATVEVNVLAGASHVLSRRNRPRLPNRSMKSSGTTAGTSTRACGACSRTCTRRPRTGSAKG